MNVPIPCLCPPRGTGEARHPDGDTVTLRDPLEFVDRVTIRKTIAWLKETAPDTAIPRALAMLTELFLLNFIDAWTIVDEKGKAVAPTQAAITDRLLANDEAADVVGEAADGLYTDRYILPLFKAARSSSLTSPTAGSTSATNGTGPKHPKRSKRSSTSTSLMADTVPMRP